MGYDRKQEIDNFFDKPNGLSLRSQAWQLDYFKAEVLRLLIEYETMQTIFKKKQIESLLHEMTKKVYSEEERLHNDALKCIAKIKQH